MKIHKILFFASLLFLGVRAGADSPSVRIHIVDRGETIEYIADKYGVTVDDIRKANNWLDGIYGGLDLTIPRPAPSPDASKSKQSYTPDLSYLFTDAERHVKNKNYDKAIKVYNRILKVNPRDLTAKYNRGICYYNKGKMKQAAEDFSYVKRRDKNDDFPEAEELAESARSIQQEKSARRAEMWGNILSGVANAMAGPAPMMPMPAMPMSTISAPPMPMQMPIPPMPQFDWNSIPAATTMPSFNWDNVNWNSMPAGGYVPDAGFSISTLNTTGTSTSSSSGHQCRVCKGTGMEIVETYMGGDTKHWCDICKKDVYGAHRHVRCQTCGGNGWIN